MITGTDTEVWSARTSRQKWPAYPPPVDVTIVDEPEEEPPRVPPRRGAMLMESATKSDDEQRMYVEPGEQLG